MGFGQRLLLMTVLTGAIAQGATARAGERIENFQLLDNEGSAVELYRLKSFKHVVLISFVQGCPVLLRYLPTLNDLQRSYGKDAAFYFLYSGPLASRDELNVEMRKYGNTIPVLLDLSQFVGWSLGIKKSAEAVVISTSTWKPVYHGPIDDRIGYEADRPQVREAYLKNVLAGKRVSAVNAGDVSGCTIFYDPAYGYPPGKVSFKKVAEILTKRCLECHSPGGIAPWAMTDQQTVRQWSAMIAEVIRLHRMPPWQPDPFVGKFRGDGGLTPAEQAALLNWHREGAPTAAGPDPLRGVARAKLHETRRKPTHEFHLPEQVLPASGPLDYRYIYIDAPNDKEEWVKLRILPSNRRVLHHATVFLVGKDESLENSKERFDHYLATFAPGADYDMLSDEYLRRLPPRARLLVVLHYQATGKEEVDRPVIAMWIKPPGQKAEELVNIAMKNVDLILKPKLPDQRFSAEWKAPRAGRIHAVILHMHQRGRAIRLKANYPDGREEVLVSVPAYNFNWQNIYVLERPKKIPVGTRLTCEAAYDNSPLNPFNPDPDKYVYFGLKTSDEMLFCHLEWLND